MMSQKKKSEVVQTTLFNTLPYKDVCLHHIGVSIAPFTLALKPVSNQFSLNRFSQTTSIMWFT